MKHWNAQQLRHQPVDQKLRQQIKRQPIVFILDNLIDTFNIGSFFRLGDALAVEKIYLVGKMVTPPNVKIHRASVGTWRWVPWEQRREMLPLLRELKKKGYQIVAVEQTKTSLPYWQLEPHFPVALILGNEGRGISRQVLAATDAQVELPMLGINHSLNVYAAASVVGYYLLRKLRQA